jgi:hypothetical protein
LTANRKKKEKKKLGKGNNGGGATVTQPALCFGFFVCTYVFKIALLFVTSFRKIN